MRVVDARIRQPVPYASVGVPGKPLGTVADAQGRFRPTQTGAVPTELPELALQPQAQALGELVVKGDTWKRRRVGREADGGPVLYSFHSRADSLPEAKLGREAGAILRVRPGSVVEDAHVLINQHHFRGVRFQLNVWTVDAHNHPAASLLTQDVQFAMPDSASGWQHIDLRPYNVSVGPEKRVAVTLEWLAGQPKPGKPATWRDWPGVVMPAAFSATHHPVFRHKPKDVWQVHPVNLSLYITTVSPD